MAKYKLTYYTHDESDEEAEEFGGDMVQGTPVPPEDAAAYLELNPFYEVTFDIEYDDEARTFTVTGCDVIGQVTDVTTDRWTS